MDPTPPSTSGVLRRLTAGLLLLSTVPLALLSFSLVDDSPAVYSYSGAGLIRECTKWDPDGRRFLASTLFQGTVVEIAGVDLGGASLEERTVIRDADVAGNASLGLAVDAERRRVLVVYGDPVSGGFAAVAAYRLDSWERMFLTRLDGPGKVLVFVVLWVRLWSH